MLFLMFTTSTKREIRLSRRIRAVTTKKCKKSEMLLFYTNSYKTLIAFLPLSLPLRSSLLKLPNVYSGIRPLLYFVPKTRFHEKVTCSPGQRL